VAAVAEIMVTMVARPEQLVAPVAVAAVIMQADVQAEVARLDKVITDLPARAMHIKAVVAGALGKLEP
jgi:hypothetical protein